MPGALGGPSKHKELLQGLAKFENLGPYFWRQEMQGGKPSNDFNFQKYLRATEVYYRQIAKVWGWNRRDWTQEWSTEFYTFYKLLNFRVAQAHLREHVVLEINRLFRQLDIVCEIKLDGIPSAQDIRQVAQEMRDGKISFGAAMDKVSL